ncbi:unnamed protein product [Echinostoma caproni]|uniref:TPR_REGION domain-containing protein n=1 Tax=Echinostoma caproni TaxID=27848 RepID=A0A183A8P8_9TREM|nr:unnamed protein product [Echinostoma caproni]
MHYTPTNPSGLMQMGSKNMDRYYATLVCVCLQLNGFYTTPELQEKLVQNQSLLIELLVRYRLELPFGMSNLRGLCESVLKSMPRNPYALEALIRLKLETFLFSAFPSLISPSLDVEHNDSDDPLYFCRELCHPITTAQLDALDAHIVEHAGDIDGPGLTTSIRNTVQLGRLTSAIAGWILSGTENRSTETASANNQTDHWSDTMHAIEHMSLNGYQGIHNWRHLGLMDFHAMCLLALSTFKLHAFERCDTVTEQVLSYLAAHQNEMCLESRELSELASVPLSQLTDFLQPRPAATPFRLQLQKPNWSGTVHGCLVEWMLALRLANASASEQPALTNYASHDLVPRYIPMFQKSFYWPDVVRTLWIECCLTDQNVNLGLGVLFPNSDCSTLETVLSVYAQQSSSRAKLCCLWIAVEQALQHDETDENRLKELTDFIFALMEDFGCSKTSREHFLFGRMISRLSLCSKTAATEPRLSQPVEEDCYVAGAGADPGYYANHLSLGRIYRRMGKLKEALKSLAQAKMTCPRSPDCAYELSVALCQDRQLQKAFDCYADINPKLFTKELWLNYGLIALHLRNTLKAVPALQKVIILDPKNALYWEILGEAYLLRRSYDTAIKTLLKSIELDPKRPFAHILCGQAYRGIDETVFAIRKLEQGLELTRQGMGSQDPRHDMISLCVSALKVPHRLVSVVENRDAPDQDNNVLVCPCVCLRLADIYSACALKQWSKLERLQHTDVIPSANDSPVLQRCTLLVANGLQCLSHARYLKEGHSKACGCTLKDDDTKMNELFDLAESFFKRACRELTESAELDQQFLDGCEDQEDVAAVSKINQFESSADKVVRCRLSANRALQSKAWYGLAELISLRRSNHDLVADYCLCQALMAKPQNAEAGTSLALRLLNQGRAKVASTMITQFQALDPGNYLVWLASAHLNAVISAGGGNKSCLGNDRNQSVLRDLLQTACLGTSVGPDLVNYHLAIEFQRPFDSDSVSFSQTPIHLLLSQYFLATYLCVAEALAKGIIFLHDPNRTVEYDLARRCEFLFSTSLSG